MLKRTERPWLYRVRCGKVQHCFCMTLISEIGYVNQAVPIHCIQIPYIFHILNVLLTEVMSLIRYSLTWSLTGVPFLFRGWMTWFSIFSYRSRLQSICGFSSTHPLLFLLPACSSPISALFSAYFLSPSRIFFCIISCLLVSPGYVIPPNPFSVKLSFSKFSFFVCVLLFPWSSCCSTMKPHSECFELFFRRFFLLQIKSCHS